MDQHTPTFAGIDVSKATLDAYLHPEGSHRQFKTIKPVGVHFEDG